MEEAQSLGNRALAKAVGQLLVGGFDGPTVSSEFRALAASGHVGGAILFKRNLPSLDAARDLVREIGAIDADVPLVVSVDQEGGRVQRLRDPFPELPPMREVGDVGRKSWVHAAAMLLARSLRILGFHQNYAPVLDVDSNPDNPIIGDRSFSRDPGAVSRFGASFIDGLQSGGIAACGKHFPGHGDTSADSHLELPRLSHDRERLTNVELAPFRAAVLADVASIMTAHILFDALDAEHPATLSEKVLVPLLREQLGFRGVIVSDDLEMKAIADHYGIEDAAVRAIRAGCDQLLICHQVEWVARAHEAIVKAVEAGTLDRGRVLEAAERVERLKRDFVIGKDPPVEGDVKAALPLAEHELLMREFGGDPPPGTEGILDYEFEGDPNDIPELDI